MKIKLYFIVANILLLATLAFTAIPERIYTLQKQSATLRLSRRQLTLMEENLKMYEENIALLSALQHERGYIIQPSWHIGALLTEVRGMLHMQRLAEQEFYAREHSLHYVNGQPIAQTRVTIIATGNYDDIKAFLVDMASHYRYFHLEQIQISRNHYPTQLWLTFSIYGKA